jgi:hypothetical protein
MNVTNGLLCLLIVAVLGTWVNEDDHVRTFTTTAMGVLTLAALVFFGLAVAGLLGAHHG